MHSWFFLLPNPIVIMHCYLSLLKTMLCTCVYLNKKSTDCSWTLYLNFTFWVGKVNSSRSNLRNFTSIQLCVSIVIYRFRGTKIHDGSLEYQALNVLFHWMFLLQYETTINDFLFLSLGPLTSDDSRTKSEFFFNICRLFFDYFCFSFLLFRISFQFRLVWIDP